MVNTWEAKSITGLVLFAILLSLIGLLANMLYPGLTTLLIFIELIIFILITTNVIRQFKRRSAGELGGRILTGEGGSSSTYPKPQIKIQTPEERARVNMVITKIYELEEKIVNLKENLAEKERLIDELKAEIKEKGLSTIDIEKQAEISALKEILASIEDRYNKKLISKDVYMNLKSKYENKINKISSERKSN
jgi:hypothetical protein